MNFELLHALRKHSVSSSVVLFFTLLCVFFPRESERMEFCQRSRLNPFSQNQVSVKTCHWVGWNQPNRESKTARPAALRHCWFVSLVGDLNIGSWTPLTHFFPLPSFQNPPRGKIARRKNCEAKVTPTGRMRPLQRAFRLLTCSQHGLNFAFYSVCLLTQETLLSKKYQRCGQRFTCASFH